MLPVQNNINSGIQDLFSKYIVQYKKVPRFNYLGNAYILTPQLNQLQSELLKVYPEYYDQITTNFAKIITRLNKFKN